MGILTRASVWSGHTAVRIIANIRVDASLCMVLFTYPCDFFGCKLAPCGIEAVEECCISWVVFDVFEEGEDVSSVW